MVLKCSFSAAIWSYAVCRKCSRERRDGVETYIRREMHKNRTYTKYIIHLCQINRAVAYLSIVLAGGHFEVWDFHFIQGLICNYYSRRQTLSAHRLTNATLEGDKEIDF